MAETAVDALGHVDVVFGGSPGIVGTGLGLDGDGPSGTGALTQFAGDAPFLTSGVSPQRVFPSKTRR